MSEKRKKVVRVVRKNSPNVNHHLWNNNGTWFIHYTVYPTPVTAERIRRSLKTRDVREARVRRDEVFRQYRVGEPVSPHSLGLRGEAA